MTMRNFSRPQFFSSSSRARFFLLSQNEASMRHAGCKTVQALPLLCQSPQFAVGRFVRNRLVSDAGDCFSPVRACLDARLFQLLPKVAAFRKEEQCQTPSRMGQVAGKKVCKGEPRSARWRWQLKSKPPAGSGRECRRKCRTMAKTP